MHFAFHHLSISNLQLFKPIILSFKIVSRRLPWPLVYVLDSDNGNASFHYVTEAGKRIMKP